MADPADLSNYYGADKQALLKYAAGGSEELPASELFQSPWPDKVYGAIMGKVNNDFSPASVLNGLQELAHEATLAADKKAFQVAANESAALFRTLGAADFIEYDWPTMAWRLFATLRLRGITVLYLLTDIGEPQLLIQGLFQPYGGFGLDAHTSAVASGLATGGPPTTLVVVHLQATTPGQLNRVIQYLLANDVFDAATKAQLTAMTSTERCIWLKELAAFLPKDLFEGTHAVAERVAIGMAEMARGGGAAAAAAEAAAPAEAPVAGAAPAPAGGGTPASPSRSRSFLAPAARPRGLPRGLPAATPPRRSLRLLGQAWSFKANPRALSRKPRAMDRARARGEDVSTIAEKHRLYLEMRLLLINFNEKSGLGVANWPALSHCIGSLRAAGRVRADHVRNGALFDQLVASDYGMIARYIELGWRMQVSTGNVPQACVCKCAQPEHCKCN